MQFCVVPEGISRARSVVGISAGLGRAPGAGVGRAVERATLHCLQNQVKKEGGVADGHIA